MFLMNSDKDFYLIPIRDSIARVSVTGGLFKNQAELVKIELRACDWTVMKTTLKPMTGVMTTIIGFRCEC